MAKTKRRVKPKRAALADPQAESPNAESHSPDLPRWVVWCRLLAMGLLGGTLVYAGYFPSDSIQVESGDALWFSALAIIVWTLTMATQPYLGVGDRPANRSVADLRGSGVALDVLVGCLALWMAVAALASCPPGNLRFATNEAWVWIAGAAIVTSARRLLTEPSGRTMTISLVAGIAAAMAVMALYQEWISLPITRAAYLADPGSVLAEAGIEAPRGSARRMVFANRLLDGGPTATFALANSLAAVLLAAVVVPLGILSARRTIGDPFWIRALLIGLVLLGIAALVATRSRSAIGACFLASLWLWLTGGAGAVKSKEVSRAVILAGTVLIILLTGILLFGDVEWIAAAPASLQFRLHYWKSSLALLWDHPVTGAGPGGFQAMYLQYRLPVANETISDPHNFFFETLTAGGIPAGILLSVVAFTGFSCYRKSKPNAAASHSEAMQGGGVWIGYGAAAVLCLIWFWFLLTGQLTNAFENLLSVPIAIACVIIYRWLLRDVAVAKANAIFDAILIGMLVHLCVAGGWTVPGVAILIWLAAGAMTAGSGAETEIVSEPTESSQDDGTDRRARRVSMIAILVGGALLVCLRTESIGPHQQAGLLLQRADQAIRQGNVSRGNAESLAALQADPWAFEAARWRSELLRSEMAAGNRKPGLREDWEAAVAIAIERSGDNPLLWRALSEQYLHVYQVFGERRDLNRAAELIEQTVRLNPTDVSLVAQAAIVAIESRNDSRARELATRASELSELGGNVVRKLELQQIMPVEKIGAPAMGGPVQNAASDEFRRRLGITAEPEAPANRTTPTE